MVRMTGKGQQILCNRAVITMQSGETKLRLGGPFRLLIFQIPVPYKKKNPKQNRLGSILQQKGKITAPDQRLRKNL